MSKTIQWRLLFLFFHATETACKFVVKKKVWRRKGQNEEEKIIKIGIQVKTNKKGRAQTSKKEPKPLVKFLVIVYFNQVS